ncbi:uncharacterized protein EV154DRAFT_552243 [Mucor mucedo]|uniref:uncharacterized protein n=1 Tax=Mucor mucedo TaxID=29922 RepID=UPI0022201D2B|nr:uncharacterized protein EV154DRAFT_552243 [Mucor mucedo]KAI7890532.1 hypothetical protein EV154DRAFT_552243 [Mucor mucedo]
MGDGEEKLELIIFMTFTELKTKPESKMEQKLQDQLENLKNLKQKIDKQSQPYWNAIKSTFDTCWQYQEFRLGVYIFGLLSVIPAAIFVLFLSSVVFITSVLVSFIWTFFVFSAGAFGLIILLPILFSISIAVAFLIVGHDVYQYLIRLKQANKDKVIQ